MSNDRPFVLKHKITGCYFTGISVINCGWASKDITNAVEFTYMPNLLTVTTPDQADHIEVVYV